jgi:GWxTD domain-containing protein
MKPVAVGALAALLALPPTAFPSGQGEERDLALAARRFHRTALGTSVEGVCRVPFALVQALRGGPDGFGAYRVDLTVRDTTGLALTEQSWSQRVPARMLDVPGASAVEQFRFGLAAGNYTVEAAVTDSASGRVVRTTMRVEAFAERPLASDLLLSSAIRQGSDSLAPAAGEVALGGFFIAAQPQPVLTPSQSQLFYYLELYPGRATEVTVRAQVRTAEGRSLVVTDPETFRVDGAGVATSGLELAGLPPGEYRLELEIGADGAAVTRQATFRMASFATEAAIARALGDRAGDVFAQFTEDQLDLLYGPLVYLQESGERGVYEGLSLEGKRNYLRQFWTRRDPTPATPTNEAQEDFYRLINRANQEFREGGAAQVPGWRTDRGRVFTRYGEPDEVLRRPQAGNKPYEVWKYTRGRLRKFVFLDETGFGHYVLIFTDERREPSRGDWEALLGQEAVLDVKRF